MGDSIVEGTIVDIPLTPPEFVKADDVVIVLETDKVSVDVRAPEDGVITEILGKGGYTFQTTLKIHFLVTEQLTFQLLQFF